MTPTADEKYLDAIPNSPEEIWDKYYDQNFTDQKQIYLNMFPLLEEILKNHKTIRTLDNGQNIKQRIYYFAREFGNSANDIIHMCRHKKWRIEVISKEIAIGKLRPADVFMRMKNAKIFWKNNVLIADLTWRLACIRSTEIITLGAPNKDWFLENNIEGKE